MTLGGVIMTLGIGLGFLATNASAWAAATRARREPARRPYFPSSQPPPPPRPSAWGASTARQTQSQIDADEALAWRLAREENF